MTKETVEALAAILGGTIEERNRGNWTLVVDDGDNGVVIFESNTIRHYYEARHYHYRSADTFTLLKKEPSLTPAS